MHAPTIGPHVQVTASEETIGKFLIKILILQILFREVLMFTTPAYMSIILRDKLCRVSHQENIKMAQNQLIKSVISRASSS